MRSQAAAGLAVGEVGREGGLAPAGPGNAALALLPFGPKNLTSGNDALRSKLWSIRPGSLPPQPAKAFGAGRKASHHITRNPAQIRGGVSRSPWPGRPSASVVRDLREMAAGAVRQTKGQPDGHGSGSASSGDRSWGSVHGRGERPNGRRLPHRDVYPVRQLRRLMSLCRGHGPHSQGALCDDPRGRARQSPA